MLWGCHMTQPLSHPRVRRTRPIYENTLRVLPPGPRLVTPEAAAPQSATPTDAPVSHVRIGTGTVIGLAPPLPPHFAQSPLPAPPPPTLRSAVHAAPPMAAAATLAFADTLPGTMAPPQLRVAMAAMAAMTAQPGRSGLAAPPTLRHRAPSTVAAPSRATARWATVIAGALAVLAAGIAIAQWTLHQV